MIPVQDSIHTATFNFEYESKACASRCNILIESIFNSHILPELEEAISNKIPEEAILELSKLEIDIGNIKEKELSTKLGNSIKEALEKALQTNLKIKKKTKIDDVTHEEQKTDDYVIESIEIFLNKGYLPFWMHRSITIEELITKAILQSKNDFVKILKKQGKYDNAIKRISYTISPTLFDKVLLVLNSVNSPWILDFRKILMHIKKERKLNKTSDKEFIQLANYFVLQYVLNDKSVLFNKTKFSAFMIKRVTGFFNLDPQLINQSIKNYTGSTTTLSILKETLGTLQTRDVAYLTDDTEQRSEINYLLKVLNSGNIDSSSINQNLLKQDILQILNDYEKRNILFDKLNETGVILVLKLYYPNNTDLLIKLITSFSTIVSKLKNDEVLASKTVLMKKFVLDTVLYRNEYAIQMFDNEEYVLFLARAAGFKYDKTISSVAFRSFIQTQEHIDVKKIDALIEDEQSYKEISSIQKLLSENKPKIRGTRVAEYFAIYRRKIIGYYLDSGQLPKLFYDLNKRDVQRLFNDLIEQKDQFLISLFLKNEDPKKVIGRLQSLIANKPFDEYEAYVVHFFEEEYQILSKIFQKLSNNNVHKTRASESELYVSFENLKGKDTEKLKVFLILIMGDQGLFEKFISRAKDDQIPLELLIENKNIKIYLDALISFSPESFLNNIDRKFWKSLVISFAILIFIKEDKFTLDTFVNAFMNHLREKLKVKNEVKIFDFIIEKMNMSGVKELKALVNVWQVSDKKAYNITDTYAIDISGYDMSTLDKNEKKRLQHDLSILRFYAHKGFLPWWAESSFFSEILDRLYSYSEVHPKIFEKVFLELEIATPIFDQLISKISSTTIDTFGKLFANHTQLSILWQESLQKTDQNTSLELRYDENQITSSGQSRESIHIQHYLEQLNSFSPDALSDSVETKFWGSVVSSFKKLISRKETEYTLDIFTNTFINHLFQKLRAINEEKMLDIIIEKMNASGIKELKAMAESWQVSDRKVYYIPDTYIIDHSVYENGVFDAKNEIQTIQNDLSVLWFYAYKGFLPWWSERSSLSEMLDHLYHYGEEYPNIFEEVFLKLERKEHVLDPLISKISNTEIDTFGQLFSNHKQLKILWKESLQKTDKNINLEIGFKEDKKWSYDQKNDIALDQLFKNKDTNTDLLFKSLYFLSDEDILNQWDANPKIIKQVKEYILLSPYFYFRNINPTNWRGAVFEFAFEYYKKKNSEPSNRFSGDFLKYLERKYSYVKWIEILTSVYHLLQSSTINRQIVFPEQLIPFIKTDSSISRNEYDMIKKAGDLVAEDGSEIQIKVNNVGLILFWPFLTRFFEHLSLIKNGTFINQECKNKAVYILQYLVCNEINFPEHQLVLNKVLVGMPLQDHLFPFVKLSGEEKDTTYSLLYGLINNWEKVKASTPEGIQETFLQREGVLRFKKDTILLEVSKKGVDVLLDSISWNISLVKLPWMKKPIHVDWK